MALRILRTWFYLIDLNFQKKIAHYWTSYFLPWFAIAAWTLSTGWSAKFNIELISLDLEVPRKFSCKLCCKPLALNWEINERTHFVADGQGNENHYAFRGIIMNKHRESNLCLKIPWIRIRAHIISTIGYRNELLLLIHLKSLWWVFERSCRIRGIQFRWSFANARCLRIRSHDINKMLVPFGISSMHAW